MIMNVDTVITQRKSIRSFQPRSVSDEMLESLIDIARNAPSWMNKQCWHFIVVKKESLIEEIASTSITNRWLKRVPSIVIVCADPHLSGERGDLSYFLVDAAIAMDHLVLSATDKGLGTCWIGSFDETKLKQILGIPPRIRIVALTPIGFPQEKASFGDRLRSTIVRSPKRKALAEIMHWNHW